MASQNCKEKRKEISSLLLVPVYGFLRSISIPTMAIAMIIAAVAPAK